MHGYLRQAPGRGRVARRHLVYLRSVVGTLRTFSKLSRGYWDNSGVIGDVGSYGTGRSG